MRNRLSFLLLITLIVSNCSSSRKPMVVTNQIYFDEETKLWKDDYGICHTCTPQNGFGLDGKMNTQIENSN